MLKDQSGQKKMYRHFSPELQDQMPWIRTKSLGLRHLPLNTSPVWHLIAPSPNKWSGQVLAQE